MRGRSKSSAWAAALVALALLGTVPVYGQQRHDVVRHVRHESCQTGFGVMIGGPYPGIIGYGGGLYPGAVGYGGGLYLGLGGRRGGVILGLGGYSGIPYSYTVPDVYITGASTAPVYSVYSGYPYYGSTITPVSPVYGSTVSPVPPVATSDYILQPVVPSVLVPRSARAGDPLVIERVNDDILRLTWRDDESHVREVTLFVADAGQRVLAQQTLRTAPFTALFDTTPATAYAGVTLHYPDGVKTTTFIPARGR